MGPKIIFYFAGAKFVEVIRYLLPGVTPDKIGIALGKADFSQGVHHGWTRKYFREKDGVGMTLAHIGNQPLPERQRFSMRIVHPENLYPFRDLVEDDISPSHPETRHRLDRIHFHIENILIFFSRIFRVANGTIGPPVKPLRVLL